MTWFGKRSRTSFSLCVSLSLLFAACRAQSDSAPTKNSSSETIVSSTPPFQTKEPDRYRATRIITIVNSSGETVVTKTSIARNGESRRHESENVAFLDVPAGRFIVLLTDNVYADLADDSVLPTREDDDQLEISPERLLHAEASDTAYQKIGQETIGGRNTNKYRIVVNGSSPGSVSVNETLIWIDDTLSMPIRSETKSANGARITTELSDVTLEVDGRIFEVPNGYKKIAFSELRKLMTDSQPRR